MTRVRNVSSSAQLLPVKEKDKDWRPAGTAKRSLEGLREASLQELSELGCRLELWNRLQFLECRCERVRQTPNRSRPEFLVPRFEVQIVHGAREMFRSFQVALHEGFVDHHLGGDVG